MYAVINIITPTKLDRKQKSLLQDLSETDLEDAPEFKNFKKYLKENWCQFFFSWAISYGNIDKENILKYNLYKKNKRNGTDEIKI